MTHRSIRQIALVFLGVLLFSGFGSAQTKPKEGWFFTDLENRCTLPDDFVQEGMHKVFIKRTYHSEAENRLLQMAERVLPLSSKEQKLVYFSPDEMNHYFLRSKQMVKETETLSEFRYTATIRKCDAVVSPNGTPIKSYVAHIEAFWSENNGPASSADCSWEKTVIFDADGKIIGLYYPESTGGCIISSNQKKAQNCVVLGIRNGL